MGLVERGKAARERLVLSHIRLVMYLAGKRKTALSSMDLIQVLGSLSKINPSRETKAVCVSRRTFIRRLVIAVDKNHNRTTIEPENLLRMTRSCPSMSLWSPVVCCLLFAHRLFCKPSIRARRNVGRAIALHNSIDRWETLNDPQDKRAAGRLYFAPAAVRARVVGGTSRPMNTTRSPFHYSYTCSFGDSTIHRAVPVCSCVLVCAHPPPFLATPPAGGRYRSAPGRGEIRSPERREVLHLCRLVVEGGLRKGGERKLSSARRTRGVLDFGLVFPFSFVRVTCSSSLSCVLWVCRAQT